MRLSLLVALSSCGPGEKIRECWQRDPRVFTCTPTGLVAMQAYPRDLRPAVSSDYGCVLEVRDGQLHAVGTGAMCANENWANWDYGAEPHTNFSRSCGMPPPGDWEVRSSVFGTPLQINVTDTGVMTCSD